MNINNELDFFKKQNLWRGGYYEGDPLDPQARSGYDEFGLGRINGVSVLHATYLTCIKPYINKDVAALEIGPGRGGWTRCLLPAKEVWCLDAYSAEHNNFYGYIGQQDHVKYIQVDDFSCSNLPEDHFSYMFSFGCLCHVSYEGAYEYAKNMLNKLKPGANCFWMMADYKKYNRTVTSRPQLDLNQSEEFIQGRWFNNYEKILGALPTLGYEIQNEDVGTCLRDPIIHFKKPV